MVNLNLQEMKSVFSLIIVRVRYI